MANPTNTKEKLVADVNAMMDAALTTIADWAVTPTDGAWPLGLVAWSVEMAAIDVAVLVLNTPGHSDRDAFMVDSDPLLHKDVLPAHIGEAGSVRVRHETAGSYEYSVPVSLFWANFFARRATYLGQPHHHITDDDVILFTGHATEKRAIVRHAPLDIGDPGVASFFDTYPSDLLSAVKIRACMLIAANRGHNVAVAMYWRGLFQEEIARLRINMENVPEAVSRVEDQ
jgi:hypothetical protein